MNGILRFYNIGGEIIARPKGTGKEYQVAKKLVEQKILLEELVSDDILDAYHILTDVMRNTDEKGAIRASAARTVIDMYDKFYKQRKGTAETSLEEFKALETKSSADADGRPLLKLTYGG